MSKRCAGFRYISPCCPWTPVSGHLQSGGGAARDRLALFLECCIRRTQAFNELRTGTRGRSPDKRRFWIIFHGKLRAFCASLAEEARRQGQGKVDSRCHARAGYPVAINHDALAHRHRAEIRKLIEREPMAGGSITGEEPRGSQNGDPVQTEVT